MIIMLFSSPYRFCVTQGSKSGGVSGSFLKLDWLCCRVDHVVSCQFVAAGVTIWTSLIVPEITRIHEFVLSCSSHVFFPPLCHADSEHRHSSRESDWLSGVDVRRWRCHQLRHGFPVAHPLHALLLRVLVQAHLQGFQVRRCQSWTCLPASPAASVLTAVFVSTQDW